MIANILIRLIIYRFHLCEGSLENSWSLAKRLPREAVWTSWSGGTQRSKSGPISPQWHLRLLLVRHIWTSLIFRPLTATKKP